MHSLRHPWWLPGECADVDELIEMDFTLVPTLNIYQANRDLMRERTAEWHPLYTRGLLRAIANGPWILLV